MFHSINMYIKVLFIYGNFLSVSFRHASWFLAIQMFDFSFFITAAFFHFKSALS